ncbi:transcription factor bHLH [Quillaja saponaria]|uniref:Transcription factor bHLH n=1 Tax=Quillaja saponaria TaxID=32244 RepID=A0AAD7PGW4_QUISA|nr:transcription factor bHLH [Quillaja saponaria]
MAEEYTGNSIATSSLTPLNWWNLHATNSSLSSWTNSNTWSQANPNSSSSCEEDVSASTSFTNASNHSGLTMEYSSRQLVEPTASSNEFINGEHASDNHIWNHVLLGVGGHGELQNNQDVGENFLDALSSKSMSTAIFEPACNYLKKLDNSWEFNGYNESMTENERVTKLSNLISMFDPQTNNISALSSSIDQYMKPNFGDSTSCEMVTNRSAGNFPFQSHDLKVEHEHHGSEIQGSMLARSYDRNSVGYQLGVNNYPMVEDNGKYFYGMSNLSSCTKNFADVISFNGRLSKPLLGIPALKPCFRSLNLSDSKKQSIQNSSQLQTRSNGGRRGSGTTAEAKKKRSEDSADTILKKPKHESSTIVKVQAPKVKLGDRITALQQIVSPFGKTDTASVLYEAIGYIKFLQEQVQLLSNPYLKTNSFKFSNVCRMSGEAWIERIKEMQRLILGAEVFV